MYFIVRSDAFAAVYEPGRTANNVAARRARRRSSPSRRPTSSSMAWSRRRRGRSATRCTVSYNVRNTGNDVADALMKEELRLVDASGVNATRVIADGSVAIRRTLAPGASFAQTVTFTVPAIPPATGASRSSPTGRATSPSRSESDNVAATTITVVSPDLVVADLATTGTLQGGEAIRLTWSTRNAGNAAAATSRCRLPLARRRRRRRRRQARRGAARRARGGRERSVAAVVHACRSSSRGPWRLIVVTDSGSANNENTAGETNNVDSLAIDVARDFFADLAVTVGDRAAARHRRPGDGPRDVDGDEPRHRPRPHARLDRPHRLLDNDVIGDNDDVVLGNVAHGGGLAVGASYSGSIDYRFGPAFAKHGKVFVVTDAAQVVWEHGQEANNTGATAQPLDVVPIPYADLRVEAVSTPSTAFSGKPIDITWTVANRGIGITDSSAWGDSVWLSANPDGSGQRWDLGSASHVGQLSPATATFARSWRRCPRDSPEPTT
jgi:hypothetical protein